MSEKSHQPVKVERCAISSREKQTISMSRLTELSALGIVLF